MDHGHFGLKSTYLKDALTYRSISTKNVTKDSHFWAGPPPGGPQDPPWALSKA